ncbi:hypothetical protein T01_13300 [Trichinella spiralis]|uniref:Uncharacterized protein n=1 Tax=Trichinella spiralis TaxID=6334 RepID=A0A0V1AHA1_TRISP|nr:hypothetical protein T01_13300 [Trichinella spiralis]
MLSTEIERKTETKINLTMNMCLLIFFVARMPFVDFE